MVSFYPQGRRSSSVSPKERLAGGRWLQFLLPSLCSMVFVGRARKPVWTPDAYALEKVAWSSKGLPDHGGWRKAKKRPLVHNR